MPNIWFTSDTHFFHKRILEFCPKTRKGSDAMEMTELLVEQWNDQVSPQDTVYLLGDVSWGKAEETAQVVSRLKGNKYLILGNHDSVMTTKSIREKFVHVSSYLEHKIDGVDVMMFHFPVLQWNKMHYGSFHLFGHVHGDPMGIAGKAMDVGIDARPEGDMKLFSWDEVRAYMADRPILPHH